MVRIPSAACLETETQPFGQTADGVPRRLGVELHGAAEEAVGIEAAQHHIRVGHRRLRSAPAVACRSWHGTGRLWSDAEGAGAVAMGDRTAAGPDGVDVDHRHQNGKTADPGVARGRLGETAVDDDTDIGRGAADIEGDQPVAPGQRAAPGTAEHAGSRSREQGRSPGS